MKKLLSVMIMLLVLFSTSVYVKAEPKTLKTVGTWNAVVNTEVDPIYGKTTVSILTGGVKGEEGIFYMQFITLVNESQYSAQMDLHVPDGLYFTSNEVAFKADNEKPLSMYMVIFPTTEDPLTTRSIGGDDVHILLENLVERKTLLVDTNLNSERRILTIDLNGFTECILALEDYANNR